MKPCPSADGLPGLPCSRGVGHSGDHCDVVGHWWPQSAGEQHATREPFPGWPVDAPAVYVDADGEHGWDDPVAPDSDDRYRLAIREHAYDLAAAHGISIDDLMDRQRLRSGDDEKMSPPWVDDGNGFG